MRVMYKYDNKIKIIESLYVGQTERGIVVDSIFATKTNKVLGSVLNFEVKGVELLLIESFSTGLLDLSNAKLLED